jgi:hypothetical protein
MGGSTMMEILVVGALLWAVFAKSEGAISRFMPGGDKSGDKKTPQDHLLFLIQYMRTHSVTPEQLAEAWRSAPAQEIMPEEKHARGDIVSRVMFSLGAVLVFSGIGVYISMFWNEMPSFMRILVTLGVGIALSALSVVAMKEGKYKRAIQPLILMAVLMQTGGWFVFLHEMFPQGDDWRKASLFCFGAMAVQQALIFNTFRRDDLAFTAIGFTYGALQMALSIAGMRDEYIALLLGGSVLYTAHVLQGTTHRALSTVFFFLGGVWFNTGMYTVLERAASMNVAAMVTGVSLCSLGNAMRHAGEQKLAGLGFFFGSALFYAALFDEVHHTPLELLYFIVAIALMYVSAMLHSRALLITSVLAMLGFIGYYTSEYFMHSVGWPVALIIMGIAFLGVGTMAIRVKRKFNL